MSSNLCYTFSSKRELQMLVSLFNVSAAEGMLNVPLLPLSALTLK